MSQSKVWVYPEKNYEVLGAERWQVSWEQVKKMAEPKLDRNEDIDPDMDIEYLHVNYKKKEPAIARAHKIIASGVTAYGVVSVTRQVVDWYVEEDSIAEWVNTSDTEEVTSCPL